MAHEDAAQEDHALAEAVPAGPGRITRVILKNYKSIVSCDVELQPFTILVGPNGSGKSNFLDALAFVSEALTVGLEQAIRNRGNIDRILSAARPPGDDSFSIDVYFTFTTGMQGYYSFGIAQLPNGEFNVTHDRLVPVGGAFPVGPRLWSDERYPPTLMLARHAESEQMRQTYKLMSNMAFYNPLPDAMRELKRRDLSPHLLPDGSNVATMLSRMQAADPDFVWRIEQYMKRVLPGLVSIATVDLAGRDLLQISVASDDPEKPFVFDADQLSDGTLRALAVLMALRQGRLGGKSSTSLVGIEEPENNIHPAAARILLAAMQDASYDTQVLVTTHSADMLHMGDADLNSILVVVAEDGTTTIGQIDAVSQSIVRDHLYTVGEMMQMDQLRPEPPADALNGDAPAPQPAAGRS